MIKIKIAIIADIHGNPVALKEILRDAKENNVDEIIYLGDLVNDFPFGNETLEMVKNSSNKVLRGNKEQYLIEYEEEKYLFMATKRGIVKKTSVTDYANIRKTGLAAINLREDDELIEVKITDNTDDIFLFTKYGQCIRFHETDVRQTGRTTMGVIGMNLTAGDEVIAMQKASQGESVMIVSEKGLYFYSLGC